MESYVHKVDKYALIVTAANEIQAHLKEYENEVASRQSFHLAHIEKAATFIKFVEDVYITAGSENFNTDNINGLWHFANKDISAMDELSDIERNTPIIRIVERYQREINGKFNNLTAPF